MLKNCKFRLQNYLFNLSVLQQLKTKISQYAPFSFLAIIIFMGCITAVAFENVLLLAAPVLFLVIYWTIVDFKAVFFLLMACIPLSYEYEFPNGLGTDLPTEPLIIGLMLAYFLFIIKKGVIINEGLFFKNPITLLLLLHFGWIIICTLNAQNHILSIKYSLAKLWYITTFYFLAGYILRDFRRIELFFWSIFIPLLFALIITLFRHALIGFSFDEVNSVMQPFFRNHVNYASITVVFLPFVFWAWRWYRGYKSIRIILFFGIIVFLMAIQFSYTRAAYVCLVGTLAYYFVVRWRLTRYALVAVTIAGSIFIYNLLEENKYLDYAPNFNKTITHHKFENLLDATAKGEDISTMERVYRWVAGGHMIAERPVFGFGPANFYDAYRVYTVNRFKTYVSDNKEGSTVHCYFLLVAIEQGVPGFFIFMSLLCVALIKGEDIYHRSNKARKSLVMTALLVLVSILQILLINDMIETDKIGSFFFMMLALIANLDED